MNYLYGSKFEFITDHKALISVLSPNHGNKTYHSRLKRWVDCLLPFNFTINHLAGKDMGFTDLTSKSSSGKAKSPSHYEKNFEVATIKKIYKALKPTDNGEFICNAIGSSFEDSNYARLRSYVVTSVLKIINSTVSICNLKQYRTEQGNSKGIPSDFSSIDSTKFFLSTSAI